MLDATCLPRGSAVTCNIMAILKRCTVQCLNPNSHFFRDSAVESALDLESKDCWFEPTVRNVRLLEYTSLQVKSHNQNE